MASKISIISLFVVLLAAFCYSAPIENFNNTIPLRRDDIPTATVAEIHEVNMHLVPDDATGLPPIRKTRSIEDPKSEELTTQEPVADSLRSFDEREALTIQGRVADSSRLFQDDELTTQESATYSPRSLEEATIRPLEEFTPRSLEEATPGSLEEFTPRSLEEATIRPLEEFTPPSLEEVKPLTTQGSKSRPSRLFQDDELTTQENVADSPRSLDEHDALTTQKPKSRPAQSFDESESDELTTQGHVSRPKHDQRTLNGSTFVHPETSTKFHKRVIFPERLSSTTPPGSFHEDFWGLSATKEPTSTDQYPKRALGEDTTFTSEPSSATHSSVYTPHLTYNEIVVPGNVRVTAFNGTASSEYIPNHLSQGEKQPFAPDS